MSMLHYTVFEGTLSPANMTAMSVHTLLCWESCLCQHSHHLDVIFSLLCSTLKSVYLLYDEWEAQAGKRWPNSATWWCQVPQRPLLAQRIIATNFGTNLERDNIKGLFEWIWHYLLLVEPGIHWFEVCSIKVPLCNIFQFLSSWRGTYGMGLLGAGLIPPVSDPLLAPSCWGVSSPPRLSGCPVPATGLEDRAAPCHSSGRLPLHPSALCTLPGGCGVPR